MRDDGAPDFPYPVIIITLNSYYDSLDLYHISPKDNGKSPLFQCFPLKNYLRRQLSAQTCYDVFKLQSGFVRE